MANAFSASDSPIDPEAIADAFRPIILKLGRQLRREAQHFGLSALDAQILARVLLNPGIGISDLAAIEQVTRPSMSAHVKRLVAGGWLTREPATGGDQRRVQLAITAEAQRALAAIRANRNDWLARRIACLEKSEQALLASALHLLARF